MAWKTTYEILYETLKGNKNEKESGGYLIKFTMQYEENNITIYDFWIKSKSRPWLVHKVRIVTQDDYYILKVCDCEGFKYHHKCWHTTYADDFIKSHNLW